MIVKRFENRVAVVTGGNSGIRLATARRLHEEGASVAIVGRNRETLEAAARSLGGDVLTVQADVARLGDLDKLYRTVFQSFGKIDVLIVNAGIAKFAPFSETTEGFYDEIFDTNTKGAYFTIQKAVPFLNDGASIVLNAWVADQIGLVNGVAFAGGQAAADLAQRLRTPQMTE